jgi:chromosome segregation protein
MYVKTLRVAGFKSFADPTILEFEGGVNVIVGPNGSGKSNIADALAWVLGSQAPSSLRGVSMEDVIFAGSSQRSQLGMAEVQLTIDNSDRLLPLDLSEVTISRYTDRAGESEYRINEAPCRLLDIAELLSDTGIGRSIHTVVGQGQLDAVLQAKPEDRRAFIEEAAQIGKFRRRKDRALRKIERVEDNLTRLSDVVTELRRAIRPLKRQANAAGRYTELLAEQQLLRKRLMAQDVRLLQRSANADSDHEKERLRLLTEELSSVRARLEKATEEREELARASEKAGTVAHRMARAADRLAGLGRLAEERVATVKARLAAETEEGYRERIRLLEDEERRWQRETEDLSSLAGTARRRADGEDAAAQRARRKVDEADTAVGGLRRAETEAAQALVRAEGSEAAARATLGSLEARVEGVGERRDVVERALHEEVSGVEHAEKEIQTIEQELDAATERAAHAETVLEEARERSERLRDGLAATEAALSGARARAETLDEVRSLLADVPEVASRLEPLIGDARDRADLASLSEVEAKELFARSEEEVEGHWQKVARLDEELRRLDALQSAGAERLGGARRRRESREVELSAVNEELAGIRDALADAERAAAEDRAALPERRAALDQQTGERERAESVFREAREAASGAIARAREAELEARATEERALGARLRLEEAQAGIADARSALAGLADLRTGLEEARSRAETVAEVATDAAQKAETWVAEAEERALEARSAAQAGESHVVSLTNRERELAAHLGELSRKHNEAEVRRAEARARIEALAERAMDEWGMALVEMGPLEGFEPGEEEEARKHVEKLERQMKAMGAVNPRAAEEYQELAERETFLEEQMEDLRSSKRDLMKVVREIDDTIVAVFREAYEDVARQFEEVFGRLFPGGSGQLKLTDPDDVLNSGIEVEARPHGKKVKKLSLLSGGERSLVALCFLFAIFRARPSPFYLLDEVEAALDDINLQRFIGLVQELEESAQVMVVTHQKRTMEAADVIYGVTMNKEGVSRVVAKRMQELTI